MPTQAFPFSQASTWDLVAPGYAEVSVGHFEKYAEDALRIAQVEPHEHVLDVATGPGSLALLASQRVQQVDALDFSDGMLAQLNQRVQALGTTNVRTHQGDGQNLPFEAGTFDAAFSMFGLMFFPDRAAGFTELHRVLRPDGRCVVASWQPMDQVEIFGAVFEALFAELPDLPREEPDVPLGNRDAIQAEMSAAGFTVEIHESTHASESATIEDFWITMRRAFAPVVLLENEMGTDTFDNVSAGVQRRLLARYGNGPVSVTMPAWLATGRRPT